MLTVWLLSCFTCDQGRRGWGHACVSKLNAYHLSFLPGKPAGDGESYGTVPAREKAGSEKIG